MKPHNFTKLVESYARTLNRRLKKKQEKLTGHTERTICVTMKILMQHKNRNNSGITLKAQ